MNINKLAQLIRVAPDPVLRKACEAFTEAEIVSAESRRLVSAMEALVRKTDLAIGIAAPQVTIYLFLFSIVEPFVASLSLTLTTDTSDRRCEATLHRAGHDARSAALCDVQSQGDATR